MPNDDGLPDLLATTLAGDAFSSSASAATVRVAAPQANDAPLTGPPSLSEPAIGEALARHGHATIGEDGPRYAIGACIGSGTSAHVWSVHDITMLRSVAMKVLNTDHGRPQDIAAFVTEARLTAALQHPNVLPVHDLMVDDSGRPCFSMKSIEGMTLGSALTQADTGETPSVIATTNAVVSAFIAVAQALSYAHHQGIVHQDVKPDNILLGHFGEVLLLDWGCARHLDDMDWRIYGTPYYMSPEQARREGSDQRSDVYCLGATLFHTMIRRPPLMARPNTRYWELKRTGTIDFPSQSERARVPAPLLAIVLRAIESDPNRRYQSMEDMLADLRTYQGGLAVAAHRETLTHSLMRWIQRHRSGVFASAVIIVSLGTALAIVANERAKERARWRHVASDDFSDGAVAASQRWDFLSKTIQKSWSRRAYVPLSEASDLATVVNGRLEIGSFGHGVNARWHTSMAGDLRVEWTCTPLVNNLNLNCFIGKDRESGLSLEVGSWGDARYAAIFRNSTEVIDYTYLDNPPQVGRAHDFILERENGRIRLSYEGKWILQADEIEAVDAMAPITFGFDAYNESRLAIDNVRIASRPLPERISPIAVGGRLFQLGLFELAHDQFRELATLRATEDVGIEAAYHAAVCLARLEDPQAAAALLAFEAKHPNHHLAPYAIFERAVIAEKNGQRDIIDACCQAMLRYPDPRIRERLVAHLGKDSEASFRERQGLAAKSAEETDRFVVYLLDEARRIYDQANRLNIRLQRHDVLENIAERLRACGRSQAALDISPAEASIRIRCLIDLGRLAEALTASTWSLNQHAEVQEALGDYQALTTSTRQTYRVLGWYRLGNLEALQKEGEWDELLGDLLIDQGQAADVAIETRWPLHVRAHAWAELGQWQAIADTESLDLSLHSEALCRLGRGDEAAARYAWDSSSLGIVAAYRLHQGDREGCRALVERLEQTPPNHLMRSSLWGHYLMPVVLRARLGDPDPAKHLHQLTEWQRQVYSGRLAAFAAYLSGNANEATIRNQPGALCIDSQLLIAQAVAAEIAGKTGEARALWAAILATPSWQLLESGRLKPMARLLALDPLPIP